MKRILYVIGLCFVFNMYGSSKVETKRVVVINHDPNAGYLVALKYESGIGNVVKRNTIEVPKAKAILPKQQKPKLGGKPTKVKPVQVIPMPADVKGRGKIFYMGVYPAGTTRPSIFYTTNYTKPIYDHPVSADKSEMVFEVYGQQADGFKVKW